MFSSTSQYSTTIVELNNLEIPANIYLFKVSNKNTGERCEICSKFTVKTSLMFNRNW